MKRLLLLSLVAAATAFAQDEKSAKAFKEAVLSMDASSVARAAADVAKADGKDAVDTLLDGYGICAMQLKQLWAEKQKWQQEVRKYSSFEVDWSRNPPIVMAGDVNEYQKWQAATKEAQAVEKKIMSVEAVKREIVTALGTFKSDASVRELVSKLKNDSNWTRRAGIAEALGQIAHAESVPALLDRLKGDSEAGVKVACLDALRAAKAKGADAVAAIGAALKSEYWQVSSAAALALRSLGKDAKDAVEPLIEALKAADGRLKHELNDALVAITGVDKHGDPAAWRAWFEANRESVARGEYKPKAGEAPADQKGSTTFYGIPVKSKNVIFILDRSGSMAEPSEWDIPPDVATGGGGAGPDIKKEGDRKIDIARWQLKRTLATLQDGVMFNLVFYNHEWKIMSESMVKLSTSTRRTAYDFIDKLDPVGGTNIFDPIEKGFTFAGAGEKVAKGGVDTIFLLTDGLPNSGQVPNADDIVKKVRDMNRAKKLVINTIGVFSTSKGPRPAGAPDEATEGSKFLKTLADENGGMFVSAMKGGGGGGGRPKPK